MKQEKDPAVHHELSRRELLRMGAIGAAAAATFGAGVGTVLSKDANEAKDMRAKGVQPEIIAPEKTPYELLVEKSEAVEGIHHTLHRNEHGFYEYKVFKRELIVPRAIVVHWTANNYEQGNSLGGLIRDLKANDECDPGECGYGVVANSQGVIFQLADQLNTRTNHALGMNTEAIGVSAEGDNETDLLNNTAQYESVLYAVRTLQQIFGIPTHPDLSTKTGVLGHHETDSAYGNNVKSDPGDHYMARLRHDLEVQQ